MPRLAPRLISCALILYLLWAAISTTTAFPWRLWAEEPPRPFETNPLGPEPEKEIAWFLATGLIEEDVVDGLFLELGKSAFVIIRKAVLRKAVRRLQTDLIVHGCVATGLLLARWAAKRRQASSPPNKEATTQSHSG